MAHGCTHTCIFPVLYMDVHIHVYSLYCTWMYTYMYIACTCTRRIRNIDVQWHRMPAHTPVQCMCTKYGLSMKNHMYKCIKESHNKFCSERKYGFTRCLQTCTRLCNPRAIAMGGGDPSVIVRYCWNWNFDCKWHPNLFMIFYPPPLRPHGTVHCTCMWKRTWTLKM